MKKKEQRSENSENAAQAALNNSCIGMLPKEKRLFENLLKATDEFVQGKNYRPLSKNELLNRLNIHEDHAAIFEKILTFLIQQQKIHLEGDTYHNAPASKRLQGVILVHHRGFGFVNMAPPEEDIFIPKPFINGAIDGDLVEIECDGLDVSEKGPSGKVVAILKRAKKDIVGTVVSVDEENAYVYSSLLGSENFCCCPRTENQVTVQRGDRVMIQVLSWGPKKQPESCVIDKIIGHIDDPLSDIPFAIAANNIRVEFSKQALLEAKKYGTRVSLSEIAKREDLRKLECFTVDPDTAKDFDDALSLERLDSGYRLGVHIADVSHYVQPGSHLDMEANERCNSTYFPGQCIPMLPNELSDNLCSLKPDVNRLAVSVFVDIGADGKTVQWNIVRSVIKSQKRFTYRDAKKVIDGKKRSKHAPTMHLMVELCRILQNERAGRGSVQLSMPELVLKIDKNGIPTGTELHEYDITHQMVEEFMLKANEIVAIHLNKLGKDLTYRIHEEPAVENLRDFSALVQAFGFQLSNVPTPHDIQKFFVELEGTSNMQYLATSYIKSMKLAIYSPENIGHYGLSLEYYCHFTSPIRRYVDTVVHRILFGVSLPKSELNQICLRASGQERISARAEGSVLQIKKLRYLAELHRKNPDQQYKALVSRIKPYGIYFDIVDIMMDGFLHISDLENDYFIFDPLKNSLTGRHTGILYKAGDPIVIRLKSLDFITVEASWNMVGRERENKEKSYKRKRTRKRE
ncbi:MAG: VacB/RNase II family 3'-5' exoribonuclease [Chlamydia sp.]